MSGTSPRNIALTVAAVVATTCTLIVTLVTAFTGEVNLWTSLITFAGSFVTCYLIVVLSIQRFIYDRIKVIYKTITNLKKSRDEAREKMSVDADILTEVSEEVLNWERDKREEIEQLREAESYRREFIGNVSHELKTPIFNIQGYLLTLLEGGLEDKSINRKYLNRAMRSVERMIALTEDLETISKLEEGNSTLSLSKFDLVPMIEETMNSLEMKANRRSISIRFDKEYSKPIMVKCDADKIGQVMTNLLVNAVNYGNEGGVAEVRFHDMDEHILVEVADDGIGISEEHLGRLFERFYRTDKSRSRNEGGTGLGLAIVKHIMDAHGQSVNVRSTEGEGSTFSITLEKA